MKRKNLYNFSVNSFEKYAKIKDPTFKDLSYNNLASMINAMKVKDAQPESINNYLTHLRALFNLAKKKKIHFQIWIFHLVLCKRQGNMIKK